MNNNYFISLRKSIPLFLFALLCLVTLTPQSSQAALSAYRLTTGTGVKKVIAGNILWRGGPHRTNLASGAITIGSGFTFSLDGVSYTQMNIYQNGMITLGPTQISNIQSPSLATTNVPTIAGFWGNYGMSGGSTTGGWAQSYYACNSAPQVSYLLIGTAPSRTMVIDYAFMCTIPQYQGEALSSFQIRLNETVNNIELYYGHMTNVASCGARNGNSGNTAEAIGVTGGSNNFMSITPSGTSTNATFSSTTANNAINLASTKIPDNTMYTISKPPNVQLATAPNPKILSFGVVQSGFTSAPMCVSVSQPAGGQANLNITSAKITGNADFTFSSVPASNSYAPNDPPGQYCIVFTPKQAGVRTAVLTIASDGLDSGLQTYSLTGVGITADMSVDSNIRFKKTRTRLSDSLTQYVHITSTGLAPLFFSSFTISGIDAGQYFISHFPANPLAPGLTDSLGVTYVPTIEGKHIATLTIVSNSFTFPTYTISLQGTGILPHIVLTPTSLQFDSTAEGDTVCKTVDIWNSGTDTLRLKKNFLSSNDGDFHYTGLSGSDTAIAPDHHKTVTVCFIPLQQGTRQARLLLQTNIINTYETPRRDTASILTLDIHGNGLPLGVFGNAFEGRPILDSTLVGTSICRTDTLKNTGDADIVVSGVTFGQPNPTEFNQTGLTFPFLLKARSFKTFTVCGIPTVQGIRNSSLTFTGKTGGRTIGIVTPLGVFGLNSCIAALPTSLFTGVVLPINGSDSVLCDTIQNCGDIPATYSVAISGNQKDEYSVTPAVSGVVAPHGGTTVFCVTYKPTTAGASNASLDVSTADNSRQVSVPLAGSAGCASLAAVTPSVPNTGVFETGKFDVVINNTGSFTWDPGTMNLTPMAEFTFDTPAFTVSGNPPNQTITVHLKFRSQSTGTFTAKLSFANGGPCGTLADVSLSGTAITGSVATTTASDGFILEQSFPNPSQGKTSFNYATPREAEVSVKLVDMTGKLIRTLISGRVSQGTHVVNFDVSNLPSGTYIYLLESGSTRLSRQLVLTK